MNSDVILMGDERVRSVTVTDCREPLVDLRAVPGLRLDDRRAYANGAYGRLRADAAQRLAKAQAALPNGLGLLIVEGYRPPALQQRYFEDYLAKLQALHPQWTEDQLHKAASRFVAPPQTAPHTCGAAVDLTLWSDQDGELDLGTAVNAAPEASNNACYTDAANISAVARRNRQLLVAALAGAGLVNYPTEWWHWSYGDRYWALLAGQPAAIYGPVEAADADGIASGKTKR
jgi:D-alanyl-D-alanine dipeptidase